MMKYFYQLFLCMLLVPALQPDAQAQTFVVDTIQYNGNSNKFINLVFMGDGFQSSELNAYKTNVQNCVNYLFSISPFMEYRNYFNVFAIRVPSVQSGANHPGTASDEGSSSGQPTANVNTYFNSTFDYGSIHRLLVPQSGGEVYTTLANNLPQYDQPLILVNSPYYGGSGGSFATGSLHSSAFEVMAHEIGHSFGSLADEYYAGDNYFGEKPNMTQQNNPALIKWKNWLGTGGVGIYNYCCGGNSSVWYKPFQNCKMEALNNPYCPVCKETIVEKIHDLIGTPIVQVIPSNTAPIPYCNLPITCKLGLVKPIPNTLSIKWILNGVVLGYNTDSMTVSGLQLADGNNYLSAQVLDTTFLTRSDNHPFLHINSNLWTINKGAGYTPTLSLANDSAICAGSNIIITSSFGSTYLWSTGATTQSIVANTTGNYSVTTTDAAGGCSGHSDTVHLTVFPKPVLGNDTSLVIICGDETKDLTILYNSSGLTFDWGSLTTSTAAPKGRYILTAVNAFGCADTANITVKQLVSNWRGTTSSNWHDATNWSLNAVPDVKTHVIIRGNTNNPCIISQQNGEAASVQLFQGGTYQLLNNHVLLISGHCSSLPSD